jgi:spore maturation protein CgeB
MPVRRIDVLLFGSRSQYGVLNHFSIKFHQALLRLGINSKLIVDQKMLDEMVKNPPDYTVGFNGIPMDRNGTMMCDFYQLPHLSFMIDPPFHYPYLYENNSPYMTISCDDHACVEFLEKINFKKTFFLPHAVESELDFNVTNERIFDVVMLASFMNPEECMESWKQNYPPFFCLAMEKTAEICLSDSFTIYFEHFFNEIKSQQAQFVNDLSNRTLLNNALIDLEYYIKAKDRINLLKSVNSRVHIFGKLGSGNTWQSYLGKDNPRYIFHDEIPFEQTFEILKKTKILLKSSIKNKNGAHEGIFTALACGALPVTNENIFLKEYFEDGKNILFYNPKEKENINEKIQECLSNEKKRFAIAHQGKEVVMLHHTWDHRVLEMLSKL